MYFLEDERRIKVSVKCILQGQQDDTKLDKAGGILTGNLSGKYIAGTWL